MTNSFDLYHYYDNPRERREQQRAQERQHQRRLIACAVVGALIVLTWQYQGSLGVLESSSSSSSSSTAQYQQQPRSPLPGSILAADNGLTFHQQQRRRHGDNALTTAAAFGDRPSNNPRQPTATIPRKKILYYTKFWEHEDFMFGEGSNVFVDYNCPVSSCWVTSHKEAVANNLDEFDAILFHPNNADLSPDELQRIHEWRAPHQRFVLVHMESPLLHPDALTRLPRNFFNWTMTYLWNSDIPRPYGYFVPRLPIKDKKDISNANNNPNFHYAQIPARWIEYNQEQFLASLPHRPPEFLARARRPKGVAWLVSNCNTTSQREDYAQELSKYVNVTIFGRCSDQATLQSCHDDECYARIQRDYKFLLGFENAFCHDYITEKFFGRMNDFVVIVRGGLDDLNGKYNNDYRRLAPPHSFINANDFNDSPRQLADYLKKLDQNDNDYLSYFWWQDYYRVASPVDSGASNGIPNNDQRQQQKQQRQLQQRRRHFAQSMCRLCERLHFDNQQRVYANVSDWFTQQGQCLNKAGAL